MSEPERAFFDGPKRLQLAEAAARRGQPAQGDFFRGPSLDFRLLVVARGQDRKADSLGAINFNRIHCVKFPHSTSRFKAFAGEIIMLRAAG
jgi:hypothetical protein